MALIIACSNSRSSSATPVETPSYPPFTQEVPTLHGLVSLLDMDVLEDEMNGKLILPTAS